MNPIWNRFLSMMQRAGATLQRERIRTGQAKRDHQRMKANRKAKRRRQRKVARATRQATGQRKRHNRRGHAWHNGHPSAMSSRSW